MALYTMPWMVLCGLVNSTRRVHKFDIPVPVTFGILVERRKHDGQDSLHVVADQVAEVLVVPEVQGTLGHLYNALDGSGGSRSDHT